MIEEDKEQETKDDSGEEEVTKAEVGEEEAENAEAPLVFRAAELPVPSDGRVDRRAFLMGTIAAAGAGALVTMLGGCDGSDDTPGSDGTPSSAGTPSPDCSTDEAGGGGCVCVAVCTCDGQGGSSHYWYPT